jgi:hypothetical protein
LDPGGTTNCLQAGPESDGERVKVVMGPRALGGLGGGREGSPRGLKGLQEGHRKGSSPGKGCESKVRCGLCLKKRRNKEKIIKVKGSTFRDPAWDLASSEQAAYAARASTSA